jgi:hypothetical protein
MGSSAKAAGHPPARTNVDRIEPRSQVVRKELPSSSKTRLRFMKTISGRISPKSVVSSGRGLVFAQNMMYTHTVTVYNSRSRRLVKTISDAVNLARFGVKGHPGVVARCTGRARRHAERETCLRLELLDVRRRLR